MSKYNLFGAKKRFFWHQYQNWKSTANSNDILGLIGLISLLTDWFVVVDVACLYQVMIGSTLGLLVLNIVEQQHLHLQCVRQCHSIMLTNLKLYYAS